MNRNTIATRHRADRTRIVRTTNLTGISTSPRAGGRSFQVPRRADGPQRLGRSRSYFQANAFSFSHLDMGFAGGDRQCAAWMPRPALPGLRFSEALSRNMTRWTALRK